MYAGLTVPYFAGLGLEPNLQRIVANIALFFTLLLLATLLSLLTARFIVVKPIAEIDRTLGAAFGIVRGVLIVAILALVSSFVFISDASWWQGSVTLVLLEPFVMQLRELVSPYLSLE